MQDILTFVHENDVLVFPGLGLVFYTVLVLGLPYYYRYVSKGIDKDNKREALTKIA